MSPLCARQRKQWDGLKTGYGSYLACSLPASRLAQVLPSVSKALSSAPGSPTEADLHLRFSSLLFDAPKVLLPVLIIWASVVW